MSDCKECGFHPNRGDGFCNDICKNFWSRRTTDPMFWVNNPREAAEKKVMTEETKEKLKCYVDKKREKRLAEEAAFRADEASAAQEVGF